MSKEEEVKAIMDKVLKDAVELEFLGEKVFMTPLSYRDDMALSAIAVDISSHPDVQEVSDTAKGALMGMAHTIATVKLSMKVLKDGKLIQKYPTMADIWKLMKDAASRDAINLAYDCFINSFELSKEEKKSS